MLAPLDGASAHVIDERQVAIMEVRERMVGHLSQDQLHTLMDVMCSVFVGEGNEDNEVYIQAFIDAKRVEGRTPRTIDYYESTIRKALEYIDKPVRFIQAADIRKVLSAYSSERGCSTVTVNNVRRNLSTFFQWLEDEDVIRKSPVKRVKAAREDRTAKKPFSDTDVELIRCACRNSRDRAVVELLLSSGMRVGELVGIDRASIDLDRCEVEVIGKGRKRRMCYFSGAASLYVANYLAEREDEDPALFVSLNAPHVRLSIGAVETMIRGLGRSCGVDNCHPHRFRRTMATNRLRQGMRVEEIQMLLGHENIETTMIYAKVDDEIVRTNARRFS